MNKNKYLILGAIILVLTLFTGVYSYNSYYNNQFIKACTDLNGKDLTLDNLNNLHGKIYINISSTAVGVSSLEEKYITQYKESFSKPLDNNNSIRVNDNKSFTITKGKLDGDWVCNIKLDSQQKLATTFYYLED
jgi:hypothetical protein